MENATQTGKLTTGVSMRRSARWHFGLGIAQSVAFLMLEVSHRWAAHAAGIYAFLLIGTWLLSPTLMLGQGRMSRMRLAGWCAALMVLCALLVQHAGWLGAPLHCLPICGAVAYLGFALMLAGAANRRWFPPYADYFESAWTLGLQCALASLFTLILWGILWLGSSLFMLLGMSWLHYVLEKAWFCDPVIVMALCTGLYLADIKSDMIRGIRFLLLSLLSWLLPLLLALVITFLCAIGVIGAQPLWRTGSAVELMLGTASVLILLINAVFRSGQESDTLPLLLRWSARAACLALLPLLALAAYGLALRVAEYGWTPQRVRSAAVVIAGSVYALGYACAALQRRPWLAALAPTNVLSAYLMLALVVALNTSLADPLRLSVDSQVARLTSGRVEVDRFDYDFLKYRSGRYGTLALQRLTTEQDGPHAAAIRTTSLNASQHDREVMPKADLAHNLSAAVPGQVIPASFLQHDWASGDQSGDMPYCLQQENAKCEVYLLDLTHRGHPDVLVEPVVAGYAAGALFTQDAAGQWRLAYLTPESMSCPRVRAALAAGQFKLQPAALPDLDVAGHVFRFRRTRVDGLRGCDEDHD